MSKITQYSRISHHTLVPSSEDFTDGSWTSYDLAFSEIGVNESDKKVYIRIDDEIKEFQFSGSTAGGENLDTTLSLGNNTGTYSIEMGTTTYISSENGNGEIHFDYGGTADEVRIVSNNVGGYDSYLLVDDLTSQLKSSFGSSYSSITTTEGLISIESTDGSNTSLITIDNTTVNITSDLIMSDSSDISFINSTYTGLLDFTNITLTSNQKYYFPDTTGTLALTSDIVSGLSANLAIDNSSGNYNIIMGTSRSITTSDGGGQLDLDSFGTPGEVLLSTDSGGYNNTQLFLSTSYAELSAYDENSQTYLSGGYSASLASNYGQIIMGKGYGIELKSLNGNELISIDGEDNQISIQSIGGTVSINVANNEIQLIDNNTSSKTSSTGDKRAIFIGSKSSTFNSGVTNSVIIGGSGITATSNDTVYVPDLNIQLDKGISFGTGSSMTMVTIDMGDWDMDTTDSLNVAHSLSATEWKTIRDISLIIRNDSDNAYYFEDGRNLAVSYFESTNFVLSRLIAGTYDGADFDSTSYNRGWVTYWYTPD